jgi:hypothetical protein
VWEVNEKFENCGITRTGWSPCYRSVLDEGRGHEGEEEDQEREQGGGLATGAQGLRIMDGEHTKETNAEEKSAPNVPAAPETEA